VAYFQTLPRWEARRRTTGTSPRDRCQGAEPFKRRPNQRNANEHWNVRRGRPSDRRERGTATQSLAITINVPLVITTTSSPGGTIGVAYSQTLHSNWGAGAYTWTFVSGILREYTLANSGLLSGTRRPGERSPSPCQVTDLSLPAHTCHAGAERPGGHNNRAGWRSYPLYRSTRRK